MNEIILKTICIICVNCFKLNLCTRQYAYLSLSDKYFTISNITVTELALEAICYSHWVQVFSLLFVYMVSVALEIKHSLVSF